MSAHIRVPSGLAALLSLGLIVSPFVLGFAGSLGAWDAVVVGVIALVLALIRFVDPLGVPPMFSWIVALLGIWLIMSPFMFGFTSATGLFNDYMIVGAGYVVLGTWAAIASQPNTV